MKKTKVKMPSIRVERGVKAALSAPPASYLIVDREDFQLLLSLVPEQLKDRLVGLAENNDMEVSKVIAKHLVEGGRE